MATITLSVCGGLRREPQNKAAFVMTVQQGSMGPEQFFSLNLR
jgi:hypothetical protein